MIREGEGKTRKMFRTAIYAPPPHASQRQQKQSNTISYLVFIHQHNRIKMLRVQPIGLQQFLPNLPLERREAKGPTWIPIKVNKQIDHIRAETAVCVFMEGRVEGKRVSLMLI